MPDDELEFASDSEDLEGIKFLDDHMDREEP
jgi:hypothetical protein